MLVPAILPLVILTNGPGERRSWSLLIVEMSLHGFLEEHEYNGVEGRRKTIALSLPHGDTLPVHKLDGSCLRTARTLLDSISLGHWADLQLCYFSSLFVTTSEGSNSILEL